MLAGYTRASNARTSEAGREKEGGGERESGDEQGSQQREWESWQEESSARAMSGVMLCVHVLGENRCCT